jgi:hypothetical protein
MHKGLAITKNVSETNPKYAEVAEEYEKEVVVVGVPEAFTNFPLFNLNSYFSALIMFICALIFYLSRRIYTILCSFD